MEATLIWTKGYNNVDWTLYAKTYNRKDYKDRYFSLGWVLKAKEHPEYDIPDGYIVAVRVPNHYAMRDSYATVGTPFTKLSDAKKYLFNAVSWYGKVLNCDNEAWGGMLQ